MTQSITVLSYVGICLHRRQVSRFNWAEGRIIDISDGFGDQSSDQTILIVQEMSLVIVMQGLFEIEKQMVCEAEGHERLATLRVDCQTLFIRLNRLVHIVQLPVAVG